MNKEEFYEGVVEEMLERIVFTKVTTSSKECYYDVNDSDIIKCLGSLRNKDSIIGAIAIYMRFENVMVDIRRYEGFTSFKLKWY